MVMLSKDGLPVKQESGEPIKMSDILGMILNYLDKLSPQNAENLKWLSKNILSNLDKVTNQVAGFETVMLSEKGAGSEGILGVYHLNLLLRKAKVEGVDIPHLRRMFIDSNEDESFLDRNISALLKQLIEKVEKEFVHSKFVPKPDGEDQNIRKYPERKSPDPKIRLILPKTDGNVGFLDVPLSVVKKLVDRSGYYLENRFKALDLERLLLEGTANVPGELFELEPESVEAWQSKKNENAEPPLMAISLVSNLNDHENPLVALDPQLLLHARIVYDSVSRQANELRLEFGHVPIYGVESLQATDQVLANSLEVKATLATKLERQMPRPSLANVNIAEILDSVEPVPKPIDGVSGKKLREKSFGKEHDLWELANLMDIFEVDCELEVPQPIMDFLLKNKKYYGGAIGLFTMSGLLTSGQAAFFPVRETSGNLQIAMGLGGERLVKKLRSVLISLRNAKTIDEITDEQWQAVADFKKWYESEGYTEAFLAEKTRAEAGFGTPTTLARATGPRLRAVVEHIFSGILPSWVALLKGRWQISSLGSLPKSLAKLVEKASFWTAGSKDASVAVGILENQITARFFAKDSLLWSESLFRLMRFHGSVIGPELLSAFEKLSVDQENKDLRISSKTKEQVKNWLLNLKNDGGVENAICAEITNGNGEVRQVNLMDYLRNIGENVKIRNEVLEFARVVAILLNRSFKAHPREEGRQLFWEELLKKEFIFLAKQKLTWFLVHSLELALLTEIDAGKIAKITGSHGISLARQFHGREDDLRERIDVLDIVKNLIASIKKEEELMASNVRIKKPA